MQEVNVKVAVRVRPLLPKEKLCGEQTCVRAGSTQNQLILGSDRSFTFDHILFSKTQQEEVYKLCVEPLVASLFDGYNATVFAYGQTGSGKTYTVGGGDITTLTEEEYGIIPRALTQMFKIMEGKKGRTFTVNVSYIEIYMEELRDLLALDTPSKDLHVREDSKGNTVIVGAQEMECESLDEVMSLLESGSAARHTGSTQMNEQSSRSHSIFTVVIGQKWSEPDPVKDRIRQTSDSEMDAVEEEEINHYMSGKFHFVDLAGSERAHKTGNVGDRFKESIHINSGLLSLGNVISALGDAKKKSGHIPYRESRITRLLKDSLGGNAKTLMICCISPASSSFDESLNSLKYANRAKNIKNKPIINRDIQSIRFEEMQCEIKALREELARQRTTLSMHTDLDGQPDAAQIKELEDKIVRLQTECGHYRMIAEEAYKHIVEIQEKDILSKSQNLRLRDWMELLEELKNKVPMTLSQEELQNETIRSLQQELKKCRSHLESDETIFADKTREVNHLIDTIKEMEKSTGMLEWQLQDMGLRCQQQAEQLVAQQIKIDELEAALKMTGMQDSSIDETASLPSAPSYKGNVSGRRPKSVPAHMHKAQGDAHMLRPPSRLIKTSPALFTLERVMQSFRARSQILVSRLEDSDDVLHQTFSDDEDDDTENIAGESKVPAEHGTPEKKNRKVQRRGTFHVNKSGGDMAEKHLPEVVMPYKNGALDELRSSTHLVEGMSELVRASQESGRLINMDVQSSAEIHRKLIKQSQLKALEAHQKIRDLSINIRMKEQLIRELVKSEKDAELMNKQYAEKIKKLEKDKESAKKDLSEVQKALQTLETKDKMENSNMQKLELDYKKKIEDAKAKISALQKKQKETEKVANFAHHHEKKIEDLEHAVDRMKQQQETLHKKLKEEMDQKARLEKEMQREVQRVKDLEIRDEQTQKVLKRKTEELASAKRRLRSASGVLPPITSEEQDKIEEQRKWVDTEVERVLEQRQRNEELEKELIKREAIIAKKEAIMAEKSEMEMRQMRNSRSSQILNKNLLSLSTKLDSVERKLEEKKKELPETTEDRRLQIKEEIHKLRQMRDKLNKQRSQLDREIEDGKVLNMEEERRLIEMDEAIEALDAAIQYKDENIHIRQMEVRQSQQALAQSEENLLQKLNSLNTSETRALLSRYFEKVVSLRDEERKLHLKCSEMEVKTDEQERLIRELEGALQRSALEVDRRLTQQQREYEQKIQLLMHQLAEGGADQNGLSVPSKEKIQNLEKDLYYYKKTARDLRRKVKELLTSGAISSQVAEEAGLVNSSVQSVDSEVATPRHSSSSRSQLQSQHHAPPHHHNYSFQQQPVSNSSNSLLHRDTPVVRENTNASALSNRESSSRPTSSSSRTHHRVSEHSQATTPIKISRRDLRLMSEEEISLRRSNLSTHSQNHTPRDSLEDGGNNPWS